MSEIKLIDIKVGGQAGANDVQPEDTTRGGRGVAALNVAPSHEKSNQDQRQTQIYRGV